jgi:hypothetical protein
MRRAKLRLLRGAMTVVVCSAFSAGLSWPQASPVSDKEPATPDILKAEIEALRDAKVAWRKVEWRTCLLDALNEAVREKKPVFLWVLGGAPADGRC